ncbi:MAG: hypothetical protein CO093_06360 [Alphaproteobacteria bacterium CG_4_9_14_3_um_filter_47_13]|nr:MAG: hypothetical protein CO093_06360 [Alphaproteobacteria bacterium CG_4_9_14_3_um_filter_47_13]
MRLTTGRALRYTLLPGFIPRIADLFMSGFSHIALYMAYVYKGVKLLPAGHPYLNPANAGRYGIFHVIFEARRNLVFKRENIDQIIIFFAILIGITILFLQFFMLLAGIFIPPANAMGAYLASFFVTANPEYDLAFRMMDLTFGFKDPKPIFDSCAINAVQCQLAFIPGGTFVPVGPVYNLPTPFHVALHTLFHFYNIGILVVGFMIAMYMVVTIVGETAQSGTPFGKRFNGMWAPIRLVIAIALLTPLTFGMNGAQLLTLYAAKWGSSLATNGWTAFVTDVNNLPIQQTPATPDSLVARPNPPQFNTLVEFEFVALTCRYSEALLNRHTITSQAPAIGLPTQGGDKPAMEPFQVFTAYAGNGNTIKAPFMTTDFNTALLNANNGDIVIRFGFIDDVNFEAMSGHVKPICGEFTFNTKDITQPGALKIQEDYYNLVKEIWQDGQHNTFARNIADAYMPVSTRDPYALMPTNAYIEATVAWFNNAVQTSINDARAAQIGADWQYDYTSLGWAGAALWYQKIAEYTGGLYTSVYGLPTPNLYPEIMEHVKLQKRTDNNFVKGTDRFKPLLTSGKEIEWENERDQYMALAYFYAQSLWEPGTVTTSKNTFKDTIVSIFGLNGLLNMQCNTDIHPLAQLVGVGRSLVESAITNLGFSFGSGIAGGIAHILDESLVESVALSASSFAGQVAIIGLSIGFILYYILPFLPFIYFFFAAGGWIKGIFEAMVGLPLWALAHIRIDGEGLPGPAAMNGYFLIFEIFIRPILIIFGLLAGIIIFTAQVQVLNEIWQLVVSNVMGFNTSAIAAAPASCSATNTGIAPGPDVGSIEYLRGAADKLFYTIMYAIVVYMMAMSSFKMVDMIPNNILRWIGSSVSTFGEHTGDPAATLVQYSFMGSQMALGPINQGIQGIAARAAPRM